jgi:hypothetical protein
MPHIDRMVEEQHQEDGNITLEYPLKVCIGPSAYVTNGAEFFMDEHGFQWVKFTPKNGYYAGKEHMLRTENVTIVKE